MHELNHRVKNILATVQAIARQTFSSGQWDNTARETFEARLLAFSRAHDLLTRENWGGAEMSDVVAKLSRRIIASASRSVGQKCG